MPPKKDASAEASHLIVGFDNKECKLLAAALLSMTSPDKYDYELFAKLTGNTEGTLKKMWPPVKRKAIEAHPSFGAFLGSTPAAAKAAPAPKATPRKRKSGTPDGEETVKETTEVTPDEDGASPKKKKAPARSRGRPKKTKTDEAKTDEAKTDEVKTDEAKTDEVKTDEAKTDEAKADEAKADEAKAESEEGSSADRGDGLANPVEAEA